MERCMIVLDKTIDPELRITALKMMARERDTNTQKTIESIITNSSEEERVRIGAAHTLCLLDKREVYPLVLEVLAHNHTGIRDAAIANAYMLNDSRLLFPLINLYNRMDNQKENDWRAKTKIIQTIGFMGDPRAVDFLDSVEERLQNEASEARRRCLGNHKYLYTYNGSENERKKAAQQDQHLGVILRSKNDLTRENVATFLKQEIQGKLSMALYVVLPDDDTQPFNGCSIKIAPRRIEHFVASKGRDVLAAGEIGFDEHQNIRYLSNQSAGFMPGLSSLHWVQSALKNTDIVPPKEFTTKWPAAGYCSKDFLQLHPFSQNVS